MNKKLFALLGLTALFLILTLSVASAYGYYYQDSPSYYKNVQRTTSYRQLGYDGYERRTTLIRTVRVEPTPYHYSSFSYGYSPFYSSGYSSYYPTYSYSYNYPSYNYYPMPMHYNYGY